MDNFNNQVEERELGWDDEITAEAKEFVLLPEGTYDFQIRKPVEKGRKPASQKMPACNKAIITVTINYNGEPVDVQTQLLLHSRTEWKLSQFFECIGLKQKGQPLRMKWNEIVGCRGKCKVNHREYNGTTYNNIDEFIIPSTPTNPAPQSNQWGNTNGGW